MVHVKSLALRIQPFQYDSQHRIIVSKAQWKLIHVELVAEVHSDAKLDVQNQQFFQYFYLAYDGLDVDVAANDLHVHQQANLVQNDFLCLFFKFVVYVLLVRHVIDAFTAAQVLEYILTIVFLDQFDDPLFFF